MLARVAVIGDLAAGSALNDVSRMMKSWGPEAIYTVGDNTHHESNLDMTVGQYFRDYVSPYSGNYGSGSSSGNRFWPAIGNHDYDRPISNYTSFFTLPGNERYYAAPRQGDVQFFIVSSNTQEPDGTSSTSKQATWLKGALASSSAAWKIVLFHHPAYTSGTERNNTRMQWPFQSWGAHAVMSGHDHMYERILKNNFPYFVNGLGGAEIVPPDRVESGSQVRYSSNNGAMLIDASATSINFKFFSRDGTVRDNYTMTKSSTSTPTPPPSGDTSTTLVATKSSWKYLDNGSDAGTSWRSQSFADGGWKTGNAQLGYGDGDESTVVSYGGNAGNKYVTTYFRKHFNVSDPTKITALAMKLARDDGAVVYLNGTEVYRTNMPGGSIGYRTFASSAIEDDSFKSANISPSLLRAGDNVIAVEVHQSDTTSSDVTFDLGLTATVSGTTSTASAASMPSAFSSTEIATSAASMTSPSTTTTRKRREPLSLIA